MVLKKLGRVVTISIIDMLDVVGLTQPNQISLKSYAGDISMIYAINVQLRAYSLGRPSEYNAGGVRVCGG